MRHICKVLSVAAILALAGCDLESGKETMGNLSSTERNEDMDGKWKCGLCDEWHSDLPMAYGPAFPDLYFEIPEDERAERVELERDFCVIDGKYFFVRGRIEIPVAGLEEVFAWDVWVSQSEKNFDRTIELLDSDGRESEPPYFGWLSNRLHPYPDTLNLKTRVYTQAVGVVPSVELEPTNHPLAVEQREGITLDRVKEIAALILHPEESP